MDLQDGASYRPRPLRYRLGELLLAQWWPRLALLEGLEPPPASRAAALALLPPAWPVGARGLVLRDAPAAEFPLGLRRGSGHLEYVSRHDPLYVVDLAGDFDTYLRSHFKPKSRQNLQRAVRRFDEQFAREGQPVWRVATTPEQVQGFLQRAAALSARTYQQRLLGVGIVDDERSREAFRLAAEQGRARGYELYAGEQLVAFAWCRALGGRLVYDTIGYASEAAAHSPGNVLLYHLLADLFALGRYRLLDFGPGEAAYKSLFATRRDTAVELLFLRDGLANRWRLRLHWWLLRASVASSALLDRSGLKPMLKRTLRRLRGLN